MQHRIFDLRPKRSWIKYQNVYETLSRLLVFFYVSSNCAEVIFKTQRSIFVVVFFFAFISIDHSHSLSILLLLRTEYRTVYYYFAYCSEKKIACLLPVFCLWLFLFLFFFSKLCSFVFFAVSWFFYYNFTSFMFFEHIHTTIKKKKGKIDGRMQKAQSKETINKREKIIYEM